ncbi:hypothetical protein WN944_024278 [Citrus x changshan-huyou]|uniref:Uncharacterized protein n=1 Tax=Citrus x changshan-huyou TaxID=2935761 RepID=A0AAP0LNC6_9ROSI
MQRLQNFISSNKFNDEEFKKSEVPGETITMSFQSSGLMRRLQNCLKADKSGRPESEASSCEISDSSCSISAVDRIKLNKNVSTNKPLRDATQILSILLEPMALISNDAESTANSMIGQLPSAKGLKVVDIDDCPDLTSSKSMSNGPGDDRSISSEEAKIASKRDEFDLGFKIYVLFSEWVYYA